MRRQRGFTMVELIVVMGLGAILLGALGGLYAFAAHQTGGSLGEMLATDQASTALGDIEWTVRNAMLCEAKTKNGVTALKCTLPSLGVALKSGGETESYRPSALDKFGREDFAAGTRVWYYLSDATGAYGVAGTTLWRANRADDTDPTATDRDLKWVYEYGRTTAPRFPLVGTFSATVDATTRLVVIVLAAESADYASHRPGATDLASQRRGLSVSRNAFWGNWRT